MYSKPNQTILKSQIIINITKDIYVDRFEKIQFLLETIASFFDERSV